jgi:simple sugar transport system permease protein
MAAPDEFARDPTRQPAGSCWRHSPLTVLAVVGAIVSRGFLSVTGGAPQRPLIDVLNHAAPLMLVSLGMMTVIAIRGIDISVGAVVAIAAAVAASIIRSAGETAGHGALFAAIGGALGVAALCGAWNGLLVVGAGMQPIVATLILMIAGRGVAQLITDGQIITVYYPPFAYLGNGHLLGIPFALVLVLLVTVALRLALARTALGLFVRAIGMNPVAAHVAGVRARPIAFGLYVFCGLTAGLAGLIISSNVMSADGNNAGQLLELDAILAVALGGTPLIGGRFTVAGTVLGALVIRFNTGSIRRLPPRAWRRPCWYSRRCCNRRPRLAASPPAACGGILSARGGARCAHVAAGDHRFCSSPRRGDQSGTTTSRRSELNLPGQRLPVLVAVGMTFVILTGGIDLPWVPSSHSPP